MKNTHIILQLLIVSHLLIDFFWQPTTTLSHFSLSLGFLHVEIPREGLTQLLHVHFLSIQEKVIYKWLRSGHPAPALTGPLLSGACLSISPAIVLICK